MNDERTSRNIQVGSLNHNTNSMISQHSRSKGHIVDSGKTCINVLKLEAVTIFGGGGNIDFGQVGRISDGINNVNDEVGAWVDNLSWRGQTRTFGVCVLGDDGEGWN